MTNPTVWLAYILIVGPYVAFLLLLARRGRARARAAVRAGWWIGIPAWLLVTAVLITNTTARLASLTAWLYAVTAMAAFFFIRFLWDAPDGPRPGHEGRWCAGLWLGSQVQLWLVCSLFAPTLAGAAAGQGSARFGLVGRGLLVHHDFHRRLPYRFETGAGGEALASWRLTLLPFVGEEELAAAFAPDKAWNAPANQSASRRLVNVFLNPARLEPPGSGLKLDLLWRGPKLHSRGANGYALTHIAGAAGPKAAFRAPGAPAVHLDRLRSSRSSLLIAGEVADRDIPWAAPLDVTAPTPGEPMDRPLAGFSGVSEGGCLFLDADGGVQFISNRIDPDVLARRFVVDMKTLKEILWPERRRPDAQPADSGPQSQPKE